MWYALVEQQREWMRAWRAGDAARFDARLTATLPHGVVLRRPVRAAARRRTGPPHFDIGWPALGERVVARTPFCDLWRFTRADAQRTVLQARRSPGTRP